ncbi:MAG: replicative DNA helicase [Thermoguttaceae bacterium]
MPPRSEKSAKKPVTTDVNSLLLDRLPPHNLDAEKGLIGAMLLDPVVCDDVVSLVKADDFYSDAHRKLYATILDVHTETQGADAVLIAERLRAKDELEAVGGEAYIAQIMQEVQVTAHAVYYANIVRDKATLRQLIHTSAGVLASAFDLSLKPQEIINKAAQDIFEVCESRTQNQVQHVKVLMQSVFDLINKRMSGETSGLATGFSDLDSMTGGMHPGELTIIAARPSMGKTALAMNIADYVAVHEKRAVLVVSLEMSKMELAQRLICSRGQVDSNCFKGGYLKQDDMAKLVHASDVLQNSPLFIDDTPSRSVSEIAAVGRRLKRQNDLGLIVIDYLTLIEPDNSLDPRQEQVARMARRLKGLARELRVPIVCLAQLNRQAELTRDNRPRLSHLRESGAIEQDADVVIFVHREERYLSREEAEEKNLLNQAELIVAKQRNGAIGEIELNWFGEYTKFANKSNATEEWTGNSDVGADAYAF